MDFWDSLQRLVDESEIVLDRPAGSSHPRFPEIVYPFDYGYLKDTSGGDGHGIDVWVGPGGREVTGVVLTVDLEKRDAEQKILLGFAREEMEQIAAFHHVNRQRATLIARVR